jgi:hypothetical protein
MKLNVMPPLAVPFVADLWIGSNFSDPANGVLILGESTYGEDPPLSEYVPSWCRGWLPKPDRTFSRIFNTFSGAKASSASNIARETFWATIAFTNFVQESVGSTNKAKATPEQYRNAAVYLPIVLRCINPRPRGVLILGKGQAEFSAPIILAASIPHVICPHPTGYGIKTTILQTAWNDLQR